MTTQGGAYIFQVFYVVMSSKPQKKYFITIVSYTSITNLYLNFQTVDGFLQRKWNSDLMVLFLPNDCHRLDIWSN